MLAGIRRWFGGAIAALAPRSAPVRMAGFLGSVLVVWLWPALAIWVLSGQTETAGTLALILVYILFVVGLGPWGRRVHGYAQPLQAYGMQFSGANARGLLLGFGLGSGTLAIMMVLEGSLGWLVWQPAAGPLLSILLAGLLVALPVGWAEELLFRGWILDELEHDYSLGVALVVDSVIYAALHYLKPWSEIVESWPQFFGLCLLGAALVWAKRRQQGQLGLAMGLHAGLVWAYYAVDVGDLVRYTAAVPAWVTGVNGNPLAGGVGLVFLGAIAFGMRSK